MKGEVLPAALDILALNTRVNSRRDTMLFKTNLEPIESKIYIFYYQKS
jgi:hypothetical protein